MLSPALGEVENVEPKVPNVHSCSNLSTLCKQQLGAPAQTDVSCFFGGINVVFVLNLFIFACTILFISTQSVFSWASPTLSCQQSKFKLKHFYHKGPTPLDTICQAVWKTFSIDYPICKSFVVCAYEKNSAGLYKKIKILNFHEKCNVYISKNYVQ